jgi:hypothetical protein
MTAIPAGRLRAGGPAVTYGRSRRWTATARRILVIDDEPAILNLAARALSPTGCRSLVASGYLSKPFSLTELKLSVAACCPQLPAY